MKSSYVYILTNKWDTVLYTGVTNNLLGRMKQHKKPDPKSFVGRYHLTKLVYYEELDLHWDAILREKQIKAGSRAKKIKLIESINKEWLDLSQNWDL